jgi:pimeloyl-ACP methyl ester carboxylesterase
VFAEEMNAAMAALNKPPINNSMVIWFVVLGFGIGFMTVWLYAAIRPRFGPGVPTAVCASLAVWGLAYLYPNLFIIITNLFPRGMMTVATVWGLAEVVIAGVAGAWVYTEA